MDEKDFVTQAEYRERMARIEDEDRRQNHRIEKLENVVSSLNDLTASVREMAVTLGGMQKELEKQGKRLEVIEAEPGDKWHKATWTIVTVIITAAITFFLSRIGM